MTEPARDAGSAIVEWDAAAWSLAALAVHATGRGADALRAAAGDVLDALRIGDTDETPLTSLLGEEAAATLHNASAVAAGGWADWTNSSDAALLAQGRASGQAGAMFGRALPADAPLAQLMRRPGARMLDVGTGVGALAVGFAEAFPELRVVGIDVFDRALALAEGVVAASPAAARITVRKQDVTDFDDPEPFDVAWLPAPFLPEEALLRGLPRVVARLAPGGWVMLGHGRFGDDPVHDALTRLKTVAYGGTALDSAAARALLEQHGLVDVFAPPLPPRAPGLTLGRRPE